MVGWGPFKIKFSIKVINRLKTFCCRFNGSVNLHISGKLLLLDINEIFYLFFQTNYARLYFVARTFRNMQSQSRFWLNFVKLGIICTVILLWFLILTKWWWRKYKSNFCNEFVEMFFKFLKNEAICHKVILST